MEDLVSTSTNFVETYINTFKGLTEKQHNDFEIKKNHSFRVAENAGWLAGKLKLDEEDAKIAYFAGLLHDIGRFKQLVDFETLNDSESIDHADYAVTVIREQNVLDFMDEESKELVFRSISLHNKFELPKKLSEHELLHVHLLRDADKMDILKVITDYYINKNQPANHTLSMNLPKGTVVNPAVVKEILAGKQVSKKEVKTDLDLKIMQLSWVYDLNFKASFEFILENRFLEKIYNTLSKNDVNIEIFRKVKVYAENKVFG